MSAKNNCYGCSMTGIRRVAGFSRDCVIVLHSPTACGQIIREKDGYVLRNYMPGENVPVPIVTTNISGTGAIFGAQDQLEECLLQVIRSFAPRYIFVGSSCVVGVIGDDVAAVCDKVSRQFGLPIFAIPCCGFMNGGYEAGMKAAARFLIDAFITPGSLQQDEVILCGILDKNRNYEYEFIRDALASWNIKVNTIFPGYADIQQTKEMNRARAILLCGSYTKIASPYREIAIALGNKLSIPVISTPDPIGRSKSLDWLSTVGKQLAVDPGLIDTSVKALQQEFDKVLQQRGPYLKNKTAVLYLPALPKIPIHLDWLTELTALTSMNFQEMFVRDTDDLPTYASVEDVKQPLLQAGLSFCEESALDRADFIFTIRRNGNAPDNYIQLPYIHPPFGARGFRDFTELLFRCERNRFHKGYVRQ
ncbi:MAG: hypothetical protein IJ657_02965 [Acidaminococcaceae bacterium]|nr:hypothetical protein [Acidaminococcaceae bacterium]